jgi:hypothetical protein
MDYQNRASPNQIGEALFFEFKGNQQIRMTVGGNEDLDDVKSEKASFRPK